MGYKRRVAWEVITRSSIEDPVENGIHMWYSFLICTVFQRVCRLPLWSCISYILVSFGTNLIVGHLSGIALIRRRCRGNPLMWKRPYEVHNPLPLLHKYVSTWDALFDSHLNITQVRSYRLHVNGLHSTTLILKPSSPPLPLLQCIILRNGSWKSIWLIYGIDVLWQNNIEVWIQKEWCRWDGGWDSCDRWGWAGVEGFKMSKRWVWWYIRSHSRCVPSPRGDHDPTVNDSPHPHASLIFGLLNANFALSIPMTKSTSQTTKTHRGIWNAEECDTYLSASSFQSISLPIIENSALLSMTTLTPSCSTTSSNFPGLSTYSKWYDNPAHPLFFTPILKCWGVGDLSNALNRSTAAGV